METQDRLTPAVWLKCVLTMNSRTQLSTWVTRDIKARFAALAREHGCSASAYLRRLVLGALGTSSVRSPTELEPIRPVMPVERLSLRIRGEDLLLLKARALERHLPVSTCGSFLLRAHVRGVVPIPAAELGAIKRAVAELNAIGRNVNVIARSTYWEHPKDGPTRAELHAILRVCTELREQIKRWLIKNLSSWQAGHETPDRQAPK